MKNQVTQTVLATLATAVLLSGCGKPVGPMALPMGTPGSFEAEATRTLLASFRQLHTAVFTKLDANKDNQLDEYEAGSNIDLKDFSRADKNRNGKLTKKEFMDYATAGGLFGFARQDKNEFMKQARDAMFNAFKGLDQNKDRAVEPKELGEKAMKKANISLRIDGLHLRVAIAEKDDEIFEASDKTKDGKLSQAEFEDFCISSFMKAINPDYKPTGGGDTPAPEPAPAGDDTPPADAGN